MCHIPLKHLEEGDRGGSKAQGKDKGLNLRHTWSWFLALILTGFVTLDKLINSFRLSTIIHKMRTIIITSLF